MRPGLASLFVVVGAALVACDNGGTLVATAADAGPLDPPRVGEIVNGGGQASNGKYRVVYTVGQPAPNQGVMTSPSGQQMHGGVVGAMNGK